MVAGLVLRERVTMVEVSTTIFFFEPGFDQEAKADVAESWYDLSGFDPSTEFETVDADIAEGEPTFLSGRWESVITSLLVNEKIPERLPGLPHLRVDLREQYYAPGRADEEEVSGYITDYSDCIARFYERAREVGHEPMYVMGVDPSQLGVLFGDRAETVDTSRKGILDGDLEQLYWLQVLPSQMVESVGRENLLSAPGWRVEELDDGAVLFVAYENPHFPDLDTKEDIEDRVGVELRSYWT